MSTPVQLICGFHAIPHPGIARVGGKASELIRMIQIGFPVPDGVVLTTAFFEPWFGEVGLSDGQPDCTRLRFSDAQRAALSEALAMLSHSGQADPRFAVRSSSAEEDLTEASFAGGYETILGVTAAELEAAVVRCFASYFDERIQVYKRKQGIVSGPSQYAVIVQQQIRADAAGVAFSVNPVNNCYDEAVINANFGLGESVVSGLAEPDYFLIDKLGGKVLETKVGSKGLSVSVSVDSGTDTHERTANAITCISVEQVLQIAGLLQQVEAHYGHPVDIEWAIAGDNLYLLQVRPITTYFELPPEMMTAPGEPKTLYANSTLIEQGLQEPLSMLGTEFVQHVLRSMGRAFGGDVTGQQGMTFTAGGRYWMNLSYGIKMTGKQMAFAPGSMGDETLKVMLDRIDLNEYLPWKLPVRLQRLKRRMVFSMVPMLLPTLHAYLRPQAFLRKFHAALPIHLRKFDMRQSDRRSLAQQAERLTDLLDFFNLEYGIPLVLAAQLAQMRIKQMFSNGSPEVRDALADLGAALPGNKTAELGALMHRIAAAPEMSAANTAERFFQQLKTREFSEPFRRDWDQLVTEFGSRCPREIDVATPRPSENPVILFDQIKRTSSAISPDSSPFELAQRKREAAFRTLHEAAHKQSARKARAFTRYYMVWYSLGGYREMPKHYIIKTVAAFRQAALVRAAEFVREGRLDHPDQIFHLTMDDIEEAARRPDMDLRQRARERSEFIRRATSCKLVVRMIDSRGKIFYPPAQDSASGRLVGHSISAGVVRGRVKVLRTADEKPLLPGEILVARATDPGWTPLFINAGGIILEIGGVLQHGAVLAREYGVPCVSGISGATEILKDGQVVELDASNGIVRLIEETADS